MINTSSSAGELWIESCKGLLKSQPVNVQISQHRADFCVWVLWPGWSTGWEWDPAMEGSVLSGAPPTATAPAALTGLEGLGGGRGRTAWHGAVSVGDAYDWFFGAGSFKQIISVLC